MFYLIMFVIFVIFLFLCIFYRKLEGFEIFGFGLIGFICCLMLFPLIGAKISSELTKVESYEIVSLSTDTITEGAFFFGTGILSGKRYYFVFKKKDENAYINKRLLSKKSTIIETNEAPKVEVYKGVPNRFWFPILTFDEDKKYNIKVPKDSIIKEYDPN